MRLARHLLPSSRSHNQTFGDKTSDVCPRPSDASATVACMALAGRSTLSARLAPAISRRLEALAMRHLLCLLSACGLVVMLPVQSQAQPERYEVGQRLRAFEAAWDEHT